MKHNFLAVQYEIGGKELAYVMRVAENENLAAVLSRNRITLAQICGTEKEAGRLANYWNECSRRNGHCAI